MNLTDLLAIPRRRAPGRPALRYRGGPGGPPELSYAELAAAAERAAAVLAARGLGRGDRLALFLGNRPETAIAVLAALRLGAIVVPLNLAYRRREIAHILSDAEPRLLLAESDQLTHLDEVPAADRGGLEGILAPEELLAGPAAGAPRAGAPRAGAPRAGAPPAAAVGGDELAMLLYTSGTTGRSKGAMLTHDNLMATITGLLAAWAWEADDVLYLALPLFHTHGLVVGLLSALAAGATVELRRRFEAAAAAQELRDGRATLFFGVPTMYLRLLGELRSAPDAGAIPGMRLCCSGSAPLDPETFREFESLTGHRILERYGMTETGMNLSNLYAGERRPGSVGVPLPGVAIRIVEGEGEEVEPGGEGELWVRGAHVFAGYWRSPEKTAESFALDERGRRWFRTGDLARQDPQTGAVTLLGRRHELIISGGFNVYPREVEEVLCGCPGVREAAVVGRPDASWGEVPVAFLVVERELGDEELRAHCKAQMAGFKVPQAFVRVPALPRNALGKVQKHLLDR
jgi:malonyl-CoA/methylmalonyl-CoA synthetase